MKTIEEIKQYATLHHIPIMDDVAMEVLVDYIKQHAIKHILEIGSAIGYSAIKMALIDPLIVIDTIEKDEERFEMAQKNIQDFHMEKQIQLFLGDALTYTFDQKYDLIFIDAAKAKYQDFFNHFAPLLHPNGVIITDNLFLRGLLDKNIVELSKRKRRLVEKMEEYHDFLKNHEDYHTDFIDIGDGIAITRKR